MNFYSSHLFDQTVGIFEHISWDIIKEASKKSRVPEIFNALIKEPTTIFKNTSVKFNYLKEQTAVTIRYAASYDSKNIYLGREQTVAQVTLSTVPSNCSALFISNLSVAIKRAGLGSFIMKQILRYAHDAGYSFIFLNIAGPFQEKEAKPFFESFGFEPMALPYKNCRTGNINTWMCLYTDNTKPIKPTVKREKKNVTA